MKKLIYLLPLLLMACGKDGKPGDVYIRFTWTGNQPYIFSTNNVAIPSVFYYSTYYITEPGTYTLYYETFYGANFWFNGGYTLTSKPGEEGGIFKDGDDGEDSYFSINCDPYGATFYQVKGQQVAEDEPIIEKGENVVVDVEEGSDIVQKVEYKRIY